MAVLLIGSTGNGKSTLGNFLFDPKFKNKEYFEVGKDNLPTKIQTCKEKTQIVKYQQECNDTSHGMPDSSGAQSSTSHLSNANGITPSYTSFSNEEDEVSGSLTIIDTPGINETSGNDSEHMIDLVTTLKKQKIFKACIFVVKYTAKIDQQYRDTIKYYSTLLPDLFNHNCLIVLTHYATDERSQEIRKYQGHDHDTIIENVKKEIIESSGICFAPIVFSIDCVPFGADEEIEHKRVRDVMLSYIFALREVHMTEFHVAKTKEMKDEDRKKICSHKGNIVGYCESLKTMNGNAAEALEELKSLEERTTIIKEKLTKKEESLNDKDSDDLVIAHVWSVAEKWNPFKKQKKRFDVTSKFEVFKTQLWTRNTKWKEYTQEGNRVHGVVKGKLTRGLYASITMETKKRVKYAEDIAELKEAIESLKSEQSNAEDAEEECKKKYGQFENETSSLIKYIEENRKEIENLSRDKMTLEEAKAWLEKRKEKDTTS